MADNGCALPKFASLLENACVFLASKFGEDGTPQGGPTEPKAAPKWAAAAVMRLLGVGPRPPKFKIN